MYDYCILMAKFLFVTSMMYIRVWTLYMYIPMYVYSTCTSDPYDMCNVLLLHDDNC